MGEHMDLIRDRIKELRRVPASELIPDEKNWRLHGRTQKRHMAAVLEEIGFAGAVLARETEDGLKIVDGHLRHELAGDAEVPVLVLDVDEEEASAILATYDPLGAMANADRGKLEDVVRRLDLDRQKGTRDLIDQISKQNKIVPPTFSPAETKRDALNHVPDVAPELRVEGGQVWSLGRHILGVGSSCDEKFVNHVFQKESADLVVTDPPYGVDYTGGTGMKIKNDDIEGLERLLDSSFRNAFRVSKTGAAWYVFAPAGPNFFEFGLILKSLGIWRQTLVWVKNQAVLGRSDYDYQHEALFYGWKGGDQEHILYGWKPGGSHKLNDARGQSTVWTCDRPKKSKLHPTMKPVELVARAIKNSSDEGDLVYDPFGGSGSTLIAAEQEERRCFTIELDPVYADIILRRWEDLTGSTAVLKDGTSE
jgi:DNA modification methylase